MKILDAIRQFNTGRLYAADGQTIVWAIVQHEDGKTVVAFQDLARGIDGVIDVYVGNRDLLTNAWVLNAYDNFHYRWAKDGEVDYLRGERRKLATA